MVGGARWWIAAVCSAATVAPDSRWASWALWNAACLVRLSEWLRPDQVCTSEAACEGSGRVWAGQVVAPRVGIAGAFVCGAPGTMRGETSRERLWDVAFLVRSNDWLRPDQVCIGEVLCDGSGRVLSGRTMAPRMGAEGAFARGASGMM